MDAKTFSNTAVLTNGTRGRTNNLVHAALGMASEAAELYDVIVADGTSPMQLDHILEEAGDALWFTNLLVREMGWEFDDFIKFHTHRHFTMLANSAAMMYSAGVICDLVKKEFAYGKEFNAETLLSATSTFVDATLSILDRIGYTPEQCFAGNTAKLEKRYPGLRFDAEKCNNRDKVAEMEALNHAAQAR